MTNSLPGNPYGETERVAGTHISDDTALVVTAVMALAFEQRTANLIAAATPVDQTWLSGDQLRRSREALAEARVRLGRS